MDGKFEQLKERALDELLNYYNTESKLRTDSQRKDAVLASANVSAYTRHMATLNDRRGQELMMARHLLSDEKQFQSYCKLAFPDSPILKALKS